MIPRHIMRYLLLFLSIFKAMHFIDDRPTHYYRHSMHYTLTK